MLANVRLGSAQNVISITRHAAFQKASPGAKPEDPVERVCHELLKPLAVIGHAAKVLAEMPLGETEQALVRKIAQSTTAATHYARETGQATKLRRIVMNTRAFSPAGMVEALIADAADFACLNGATVEAEVAPSVPAGLCGPDQRIAQLLGIFLNNAIRHAKGHSVRLSAHAVQEAGEWMLILRLQTPLEALTDAALGRIDSFQAAHAHIAALFCGRGTGTATCKGLAARIGGRITLTAEPGQEVALDLSVPCKLPSGRPEPLLLV